MQQLGETRDALEKHCTAQGARSRLQNGISSHRFGENVSFAQLEACLRVVDGHSEKLFLGSSGDASIAVSFAPRPSPPPLKKRARSAEEDVERAAARVCASNDVSPETLAAATKALVSLLGVRGAAGEKAVESFGITASHPAKAGLPKLCIAVRLSPGVAVSVIELKRALAECWTDGCVSARRNDSFSDEFRLPLSDEAKEAEAAGVRSLLLVAGAATRDGAA
jgi:hypothetical protein